MSAERDPEFAGADAGIGQRAAGQQLAADWPPTAAVEREDAGEAVVATRFRL